MGGGGGTVRIGMLGDWGKRGPVKGLRRLVQGYKDVYSPVMLKCAQEFASGLETNMISAAA